MTDPETLRAIADNIRDDWPGDAMALEHIANDIGQFVSRDKFSRVLTLAKAQEAVLSSIDVKFGKKNMHLMGPWEDAMAAIQPGDSEL